MYFSSSSTIDNLDRILSDQKELLGHSGGTAYITYGISSSGAIVVVRPDGYVGTVAPLDNAGHIDEYFATFLKS